MGLRSSRRLSPGIRIHSSSSVGRPAGRCYQEVCTLLAYLNLREDKRNGRHVNDVDFKKHRRDVVMAAASLGLGDSFPVGENIRQSISRFIEAVNGDPGVRQSISASLSLTDESMLDNYLKVLDESFTAI